MELQDTVRVPLLQLLRESPPHDRAAEPESMDPVDFDAAVAERAMESSGGADAATPVTSGRELEALLLNETTADRDDVGIELDPSVLAHLGESDLHAEGGPVGAV